MEELIFKAFNVRVVGSGTDVLVFAHGAGTDQSAWQRILPYFLLQFRVVLFDLACAGSVNPDFFDFQKYSTLDGFVDDIFSILDTLKVDRCFFVGHSLSAMTGILASVRRPELFVKLILLGGSPRFINEGGDYHGGFERDVVDEAFSCIEGNYMAWVQGAAPMMVGADVPEAVQEFSRTLFNMRPDITYFVMRMAFSCDLRGVLGLVRVPCAIIQTSKDVSVPTSVAAYLYEHLGGQNTLQILNTEGHLPHLSAPALLAPAIMQAIQRQ